MAVLLYHGQDVVGIPSWLEPQGGFLGVEVFFVISGYLITALLLAEHDRNASIDLRNFWVRRGRRLLPALYAFLAATVLLASLFATDAFDKMRRDLVGAVFYISNWLQITNDESYFEAAGRPALLRHLWSLAIEEQFYLIWPIVVLLMLRHTRLRWLLAATATAVVASTALLWMLFDRVEQYGDVSSVYYRTDARAAALLIGAVGAMVWRPWTTETQHYVGRVPVRLGLDVLGTCALVVVVAMQYIFTDRLVEWSTYERLYHGGFLALSGSTLIVIAAVVTPGSRLGIALDNAVFRWVGTRSYGLYLWHWPIYQLTRPRVDVDIDGWTLLAVRLAITVVFVEASYRLIELPIRERRFRAQWGEAMRTPRGILVASATALGFIVATAAVATAIPTVDRTPRDTIEVASGSGEAAQGATADDGSGAAIAVTPAPTPSPTPTPTPVAHPTPDFGQVALPTPGPTPPVEALPPALLVLAEPTPTLDPLPPPPPLSAPFDIASSQITIIGDSVVEGAQAQLYRISNRVTVDGRIGRQWWELEGEIRLLRSSGLANDVVVIQLGNNGTFTRQMFDGVMDALSGTRLVLFINVRAPVAWEGEVNGLLAGNVSRYPDRARLIDWYSASNTHPEYFVQDGTHLQGSGQAAFRQLIESALLSLS